MWMTDFLLFGVGVMFIIAFRLFLILFFGTLILQIVWRPALVYGLKSSRINNNTLI